MMIKTTTRKTYAELQAENRRLKIKLRALQKECVETARLFVAEENKVAVLQDTLAALVTK